MSSRKFKAVVRVSLDIHVSGTWDEEATVSEVRKQALSGAEQVLGNLIGEETNPATRMMAARTVKKPQLLSIELAPQDGEVRD
jgi:hypothetical protein